MSERKTYFVNVIIPVPIRKEFTYRVPYELNEHLLEGIRVIVPFGRSKLLTGIVTKIHESAPSDYQAKYIEHILDNEPIITGKQYSFWKWISSYYMAPMGDVMNAALPSNLKLASETKIVLHPDFIEGKRILSEQQQKVVDYLEIKESLDLKELSELLGIKTVQPIVKTLIELKVIMTFEDLNEKFTPKTASFVQINPSLSELELNEIIEQFERNKTKEKQLDALLNLLHLASKLGNPNSWILKKELIDNGISTSTIQSLSKKEIIIQEKHEISRFEDHKEETNEFKELDENQKKAHHEILKSWEEHNVTLLHGVTGSGKTEIYVQLIQEQLDHGKQVLFLLPEIALTTQLIQRLSYYFGDQIGVYHSRFNQNERVEIWNHVLNNDPHKFRIILGARSSVFLPFQDLGLVIVDEEHENTFKQYDPSPRYNARDASIVLSALHGAKVLLGSATPAMESYYNAKNGKYGLVELHNRYGNLQLPEVLCADIRKERRNESMQAHFSNFLMEEMRSALNEGEQIILFQNRRGYTPMWMCEICNWTPKCKNCDVSLTYHKHNNSLKCHYCSYVSPPIGTCSACGSNRLKMIGFGTEKIEDDLELIFPDKVVGRLDLDTTRQKHSYENILNDFDDRKIDILIGTQMVTKGLDFDNVSLVGVLDADMLLNRPDFRAHERSYHLISQVAGRSGRKKKRGKVIIQTGDPDNWVISHIISHDYLGFYQNELMERKNFFYPPFYKIIEITLKHKEEGVLDNSAQQLAKSLKQVFKERVLGPEFPIVRRIQNLYLKRITLKIEREASDKAIKERLQELIDSFYSVPSNKSIKMIVDVDPA